MIKEKVKEMKKLAQEIAKDYKLSGIETGFLMVLIQQEINMSAGTTLGTHKALMNFKKRSKVRKAYNQFQRVRFGRVPWRSPEES